ncbi:bifunctional glycosyltransferase/CDP-glycerol:glycerophosphate glycerophosphotransferase [Streptacidiphilus carbonis]|uniref:bifunctional glycosyltransferase/CDP-glycerol:glycerophosphate glycerophosphotransferase n=1 Tax=Streptacidiphilus carbonis TaxID=105422 RepID=UPI000694952D|nr:bifunctional glycosyltransferase family 2 protein/CDP-glycerol:glycerophosphate glycerophosphotransferase [Streptacidiphilus carbonis]
MSAPTPNAADSPSLSVVLPVYGVADYLPRCLDSVLAADLPGLQVVAVDDCSPDGSGAILDEYAARDPRLTVLHLDANRGLGGAREAGLERATGAYVWFVDSDDWLAEGAVGTVSARLAESRPDVLVTGFARVYPDGSVEPDTWRGTLADAPDTLTLAERPALLNMILSAWNKVVRREFLLGLDVRFGDGYYEDLSVTYPLLLAAERISLLPQELYFYRREREGAITNTASPRHADAFAQYDAVFAFLDRRPDIAAPLRRLVFDRTVKQAVTVLDTPGLVPAELRADFFHRASAHFRRRRPQGYSYPGGLRGVQYRLVDRDAWGAYQRLRPLQALPRTVRRRARRTVPQARRAVRGTARRGLSAAYRRLPLDQNLAVYAAYWYRGYACNPAAIYEKALELAPSVRGVWVVQTRAQGAAMPEGVPWVLENTPAYLKLMCTAKYFVNNVNFPHTAAKRPGSVHIQTQHGTPLKYLGLDLRDRPEAAAGMDFDRLLEHVARWDYLVSPNPHSTAAFGRAYPGGYQVLETGYPRNDRLADATPEEAAAIRERLGVAAGSTAVLYAPTHREQHAAFVSPLDVEELAAALGPGYTLLVRAHYFYSRPERAGTAGDRAEGAGAAARIVDVSRHGSVEEVCLAADVLVTDYSSVMFDYAVLDRPMVVFAPDWEDYQRIRGVYFDLMEHPPGLVATTQQELTAVLADRSPSGFDGTDAAKLRSEFRERFCPWDDGGAAERVVRAVLPVAPGAVTDR